MVGLGRQPVAADDQRRAGLQERHARLVGTSRPKFEEKELADKFPVAPISVVQFFGEPCKDVDVDLRAKKGTFLAHWPPSNERAGRLQWFKSDLSADAAGRHPAELPAGEPLAPEARDEASRPSTSSTSRTSSGSSPTTPSWRSRPGQAPRRARRVHAAEPDRPPAAGRRRHRADRQRLSASAGSTSCPPRPPRRTTRRRQKAEGPRRRRRRKEKKKTATRRRPKDVFEKAEADAEGGREGQGGAKDEPALAGRGRRERRGAGRPGPEPADHGDVEQAPRKEVLDLIAGQARLRYELDDKTLAKAEINLGQPMT